MNLDDIYQTATFNLCFIYFSWLHGAHDGSMELTKVSYMNAWYLRYIYGKLFGNYITIPMDPSWVSTPPSLGVPLTSVYPWHIIVFSRDSWGWQKPINTHAGISIRGPTLGSGAPFPNDPSWVGFSEGIHASRCIASCCTIDFYSWTTHRVLATYKWWSNKSSRFLGTFGRIFVGRILQQEWQLWKPLWMIILQLPDEVFNFYPDPWGSMIPSDSYIIYFSNGLVQPPTRI